jgi:predicted heme/steroid binding protein
MGKTLKIDITEKVIAKFKEEYLELYSNKFVIGKFYVNTEEKKYELEEGYIYENGRFYRLIDTRRDVNPSVEGCDLGWC